MTQNNSNTNRLYTRFISILKIIQYLAYFLIVLFTLLAGFFSGAFLRQPIFIVFTLIQVAIVCGSVYVITQGLIAIVDLLSRIELNTRSKD